MFRNPSGQPVARYGVRYILHERARVGTGTIYSLAGKRLHPELRHTATTQLLQAEVGPMTISQWLGHTDATTTGRYLAVDLMDKRSSIQMARPASTAGTETAPWHSDTGILSSSCPSEWHRPRGLWSRPAKRFVQWDFPPKLCVFRRT